MRGEIIYEYHKLNPKDQKGFNVGFGLTWLWGRYYWRD
jgi:hypothetical protein